jgi:hypothetical protein
MMRLGTATAVFCCLLLQPAAAQERRELGAHQHGHGTLNIAIEGTRVSMELEVPGNDIVGFEHAAKTKAQRAAVEKAKTQLGTPLSLFRFPAAAGCTVKAADVKIEGGAEKAEAKPKADSKHADHDHDHSEFYAEYTLDCSAITSLTSIEFPYFAAFKGAEELEVSIITPKGQRKFEIKSSMPRLDLSGVM